MKYILTLTGILITAIIYGQLPGKIDMFYPDEYFGPIEKTDLDPMTIYFGVYESSDKEIFTIRRLHLKDTLIDEPAYGLSRRLSIDSVRPLFVISGLKLTDNSEIYGTDYGYRMLYPNDSVTYSIGQKKYRIYATGIYEKNKNEESIIRNYQVILRLGEKEKIDEQLIYKADLLNAWPAGGFDGGVAIRWIGDIDKDDSADIILTTSTDYRSWEVILLMSVHTIDKIVDEKCKYSRSAP